MAAREAHIELNTTIPRSTPARDSASNRELRSQYDNGRPTLRHCRNPILSDSAAPMARAAASAELAAVILASPSAPVADQNHLLIAH
jgi:hypothetical protein